MIIKNLSIHKDLLSAWTMRIIRSRYQQSILGGLWAIFQPAASVAILTIVFSYIIKVDTGGFPYVIFSYSAMVPWILFSSSITDMIESIVTNMNLVTKIYFPREMLVISALLARLIDFAIAFMLLIVLLIYFHLPVFTLNWIFLPIVLLVQLTLALGLGLIGAAINVFIRDAKHLFSLVLQLWFYATPIIYPLSTVPERFQKYIYLNPMTGVMQSYRAVLLNNVPPGSDLVLSAIISSIILLIGYWFFKRLEYQFADII